MTGLFGGQTQSTPASQFRFQDLPPELQNLARASATYQTGQIGQPAAPYPYAIAAPLSPSESFAVPAAAGLAAGDLSVAGPTAGQIGATLSGAYQPQSDPYIQQIVAGMQQQQQQDLSALRSTYGGLGLANSEALARAPGQLGANYAGQIGNLRLNAFEQDRARQAAIVPYGIGLPSRGIDQLLQTGGTARQAQQNMLSAAYQEWLREAENPWRAVGAANPLVERAFTPTPVTTTQTPSIFSQLIDAATAATGFFPATAAAAVI